MSTHSRTTTLLEQAKQRINHQLRRVEQRRKNLISSHSHQNEDFVRCDSEQRTHEVALAKLAHYVPTLGAEHCPIGFAYMDHDLPLSITIHPREDPAVYEHGLTCTHPGCEFSTLVGPV